MSRRDALGYLRDCVDAADKVVRITPGMTFDNYVADFVRRGAIERYLSNASEAVWQICKVDPVLGRRTRDADKIAIFRHVMVHRYYDLEPETVWEVATVHIVALRDQPLALLRELGG